MRSIDLEKKRVCDRDKRVRNSQHLRIFRMVEMLNASLLFYFGAELLSFFSLITLFRSRCVFCWVSSTSNGRAYDIFGDFMCGIGEKKRLASYTHERIDRSRSRSRAEQSDSQPFSAILCHCDDEKVKHLKDGTRKAKEKWKNRLSDIWLTHLQDDRINSTYIPLHRRWIKTLSLQINTAK